MCAIGVIPDGVERGKSIPSGSSTRPPSGGYGPVPDDPFAHATPRAKPTLLTAHRYPLGAQQPRSVPGGGAQRTVTADEFPISTTLSASVLEIQPGAMRQLHWHPLSDEWQYPS